MQLQAEKYWRSFKEAARDYFDHSTIHGVQYIVEKDRSWFERIWWVLVFGVSGFFCGRLIIDASNINPIIISFTEKQTPIWQMPFPTVTICPNIFAKSYFIDLVGLVMRLMNRRLATDDLSDLEKLHLTALSTYCSPKILTPELWNTSECNNCLAILREIRIPPEEMIHQCKFQNQRINCSAVFKELVSEYALCYTFNGFNVYRKDEPLSQDWSIDEGYKPTSGLGAYPRRAIGAGTHFSLSLVLRMKNEDVHSVCFVNPGFWLLFRMPYDIPMITTNFNEAHLGKSVTFVVKPKVVKTDGPLRAYAAANRKCYFSNERRLKYFQQYTQPNCEAECEVDMVRKLCGCLEIYVEGPKNVDVCGPRQFSCVTSVRVKLSEGNFAMCDCLPGCSMVSFESEIYSTSLNASEISGNQDQYQYSQVNIYFKESQFLTSMRSELYGNTEFLAHCGGLLGLCLGVSVISLFEIIYFCTIRLGQKLQRNEPNDHSQTTVQEFQNTRSTTAGLG